MRQPDIELLYWDGCPSWPRALAELRAEVAALGLDPQRIAVREVSTDAQAESQHFIGSPTIRVGGEEVAPAPGQAAALTCRIYRTRDGRISPVPDRADVRDALELAARRGGT